MMVLGNPGTGKSGGLASLVKAGYWLGIIDMDNGLDPLKQYIERDCPDKIDNVEYRTLRDKKIPGPDGPVIEGAAKAFKTAVDMCSLWKYDSVDEGNPWKWGPNRILVIDSLTMLADAAYDWREQLTVGKGSRYDQRAVYYDAQKALKAFLATITSEQFRTNIIVNAHIKYEESDGVRKGLPNTIGSAINSMVGAYFNSIALCETGQGGKRYIKTVSNATIDLKNPKPFAMASQYPLETGLADFFAVLRATTEEKTPPPPRPRPIVKPQQLQLKRI